MHVSFPNLQCCETGRGMKALRRVVNSLSGGSGFPWVTAQSERLGPQGIVIVSLNGQGGTRNGYRPRRLPLDSRTRFKRLASASLTSPSRYRVQSARDFNCPTAAPSSAHSRQATSRLTCYRRRCIVQRWIWLHRPSASVRWRNVPRRDPCCLSPGTED